MYAHCLSNLPVQIMENRTEKSVDLRGIRFGLPRPTPVTKKKDLSLSLIHFSSTTILFAKICVLFSKRSGSEAGLIET